MLLEPLVGPQWVLSCWHVVQKALEENQIWLDFPHLALRTLLAARLERHVSAQDLALVRLEESPPPDARPVRLLMAEEV